MTSILISPVLPPKRLVNPESKKHNSDKKEKKKGPLGYL